MRRATLAALGVALTVGAGMTPATAAPSAPDDSDALVKALTSSVRNTGGAHVAPSRAQTVPDVGNALPDLYYRIAGTNRYATAVEVSSFRVCSPTTATIDCDADGYPLGGADNPVTTASTACECSLTSFPYRSR